MPDFVAIKNQSQAQNKEIRQVPPPLHVLPFPLQALGVRVVRAIFRRIGYQKVIRDMSRLVAQAPSAIFFRFPEIPRHKRR